MKFYDDKSAEILRSKVALIGYHLGRSNGIDYLFQDGKVIIRVSGGPETNPDHTTCELSLFLPYWCFFHEEMPVFRVYHGTVMILRPGQWINYVDQLFHDARAQCLKNTAEEDETVPPEFLPINDDRIFREMVKNG